MLLRRPAQGRVTEAEGPTGIPLGKIGCECLRARVQAEASKRLYEKKTYEREGIE